jgi:hypothetical protein
MPVGSARPQARRIAVSVLMRFPAGGTREQYDETIRRLEGAGDFPPDGLEYHVCFLVDGQIRVSEIWESQEHFNPYGDRLMPILAEVGVELRGETEVFEIHNIIRR